MNIYQVASVLAVALFVPSYVVSKPQELKCPNGDPFYPDAGSVDANVSTYYLLQSLQPVHNGRNDFYKRQFLALGACS